MCFTYIDTDSACKGGLGATVMFSKDKAQSKQAVNYKDFEASK